ncbi:MAG: XRE family transcriptional regulator [Verrucomicrobia bacterium]|nr:MAG: XRE family transcriptional regulator [Verrucomicrobiota bacterium]
MAKDIRLKIARMERGLRQADLAALVNIPESHYAKIEQHRTVPPHELQEQIARAVGKARYEVFQ